MQTWVVRSFYNFCPLALDELPGLQTDLEQNGRALGIVGSVIIAEEGWNATIAGERDRLDEFADFFSRRTDAALTSVKESVSSTRPFRQWKVLLRDEIVASGIKCSADASAGSYLDAEQWDQILSSSEEYVLLDVRNSYEYEIGRFRGAEQLGLSNFSELPEMLLHLEIPKDKKILTYCTGGIRCEKAVTQLVASGYQQVFQLRDGILRYLEQYPGRAFEGECFVFDDRVALDQNLAPTRRYCFCPHCGNPGETSISCAYCEKTAIICERCAATSSLHSCSKDCCYKLTFRHPESPV